MKILACDIGSTNLKLQVFTFGADGKIASVEKSRRIDHRQHWLKAGNPLDALTSWLSEIAELITTEYSHRIDAVGFSTFREGLIGLSRSNDIVFAGNNLQPTPLGSLEESAQVTTFAGWMCWKLTGQCRITAGQRDAGAAYAKRVSDHKPNWAPLIAAGENMQSAQSKVSKVFLGGTDEQLGYVGTGLFDIQGSELVIATGTYWSVSRLSNGTAATGVRRTVGIAPFQNVDSCVLYKWGPIIEALSNGTKYGLKGEQVPTRFFGHASTFWFNKGALASTTRQAAIEDLQLACRTLGYMPGMSAVVYGGGVRSPYAHDLLHEACYDLKLTFMEGDATLRGCALIGMEYCNAH